MRPVASVSCPKADLCNRPVLAELRPPQLAEVALPAPSAIKRPDPEPPADTIDHYTGPTLAPEGGELMRRTLVMTMALVLCGAALGAERGCPVNWTKIDSGESGRTTCLDLQAVASTGHLRRFPSLSSWSTSQKTGTVKFLSVRQIAFVDCDQRKANIGSMDFFSGQGGSGDLVDTIQFSAESLRWDESLPDVVLDRVCTAAIAPN